MNNFTLKTLKEQAKNLGLKNYSKLKKDDLLTLITSLSPKPAEPAVEPSKPVEELVKLFEAEPVKMKRTKKVKQEEPVFNIEPGPVVLDFDDTEKKGRKLKKKSNSK